MHGVGLPQVPVAQRAGPQLGRDQHVAHLLDLRARGGLEVTPPAQSSSGQGQGGGSAASAACAGWSHLQRAPTALVCERVRSQGSPVCSAARERRAWLPAAAGWSAGSTSSPGCRSPLRTPPWREPEGVVWQLAGPAAAAALKPARRRLCCQRQAHPRRRSSRRGTRQSTTPAARG